MEMVFQKTRELGQALIDSEAYQNMKAAEDKAMKNQEAAQLMSDMLERRSAIQEHMQQTNPDPAVLKRLSDEMDAIQEKLQMMDDIIALTQTRGEFNAMMTQVNQVLQFIVTGRMDDGECGGDCSSCGGCH